VAAEQEGSQELRFCPTCENPINPVPMVRLMKTFVATGAQDENRTHDLRITSALD